MHICTLKDIQMGSAICLYLRTVWYWLFQINVRNTYTYPNPKHT